MKAKRRLAILGVLFSLVLACLTSAPVHAGNQKWSAWAYDQTNGDLLLFTDMMTTPQTTHLPLPSGFKEYPYSLAISHDWHYIAYVVSDENSGGSNFALLVYDRNS